MRGVMYSLRRLVTEGATHIGVATDQVIESFRNQLWPGYKTGEGIDPALWAQFPLLEEGLRAWGLMVWPMVEFEADDALASAAAKAALDLRVDQVIICSPDKDLAQCVQGTLVVQSDRVRKTMRDEAGVVAKFGVPPASIPDYLALVGDTADGFPGLPGWGAKVGRDRARQVRSRRRDSRGLPHVGRRRERAPRRFRRRSTATAIWRGSSGNSRRCGRMCRSSSRSTSWSGADQRRRCQRFVVALRWTTDALTASARYS